MDPFLLNPHDEKFFKHQPPVVLPKLQKDNFIVPNDADGTEAQREFLPMRRLIDLWDGKSTNEEMATSRDFDDRIELMTSGMDGPIMDGTTHRAELQPESATSCPWDDHRDNIFLIVLCLAAVALCVYIFLYRSPSPATVSTLTTPPSASPDLLGDNDILPVI